MKKFTASELIKRATQLADIENTDFLNHEELTNYINEAWRTVYQWLINKGDKQFVNEVQLSGNGYNGYLEYELPDDLYQILSIRTPTGEIIGRKSESESDNSNTYEVVNDRLRLYGTASNLILTYYTVPVWITFPKDTIDLEIDDINFVNGRVNGIYSAYGERVLYYSKDNLLILRNVVTGVSADLTAIYDNEYSYRLGNNHIMRFKTGVAEYYDFDGNQIYRQQWDGKDFQGHVTEDGRCVWSVYESSNESTYPVQFMNVSLFKKQYRDIMIWIGDESNYIYERNNKWYNQDGEEVLKESYSRYLRKYDDDTMMFVYNNRVYSYDGAESREMYTVPGYVWVVNQAGIVYYDGLWHLRDIHEDTEFNFPNELYVQLLAADLGLRFLFKMNADSSGLNNQYEAMRTAFMNSLTQDGNYTRITNYYRS